MMKNDVDWKKNEDAEAARKTGERTDSTGDGAMILPSQSIRQMIQNASISGTCEMVANQIQPASLDLRLYKKAWRVTASFLPGAGMRVSALLKEIAMCEIDLSPGAVLETGCVYVAELQEYLSLPPDVYALANPKSSTGRLDMFVRVITDGGTAFDKAPSGYDGPLYAVICPQTFPVMVRTGSRLAQLRFVRAAPLAETARRHQLVSIGLADGGVVGYRAKRHSGLIDIDRVGGYDAADFWEPVAAPNGRLIIDPDEFYILASKEAVSIPPTHAAEMVPFNRMMGEFVNHYAGFFDPGFGWSEAGGAGSRAVLEVRSHKTPFILEDGQTVGSLVFERLTEIPSRIYGARIGSHYQAQGLKLSKHFR
jgi:dCTP deaminase